MENRNYEAKPDACAPATRSELRYQQAGSDRPAHHGTIPLTAAIPGQASPIGVGGNTKEGKRMGAKKALKGLQDKENPGPVMKIATESPTAQDQKKSWLSESIQKDRVPRSVLASVNVNPVVAVEKQHPAEFGKTQREAKEDAAGPNVTCDSKATELSSCSGVPDDCRPATPLCTLESTDAQSKSVKTTTSESAVFTTSSGSLEDQSFAMKPKSRSSSNVHSTSDEDGNVSTGNSPSEMTTTQSENLRFTSNFDSIVGLGKGGFGRVFKAKEILSGMCFAIKIVLCKEKALQEVKALSKLDHPNIVRYQTCWLADSGYQWDSAADSYSSSQSSTDSSTMKYLYIQMELCKNITLRLWIDEKNTQNVKKSLQDSKRREEGLGIAEQIACGLEHIHSNYFIHRDLKPENILFGEQGKIKIGDFGLATADNDDEAENRVERTVKKGTPSYMAPEQETQKTYDRKVDVFALGLICFELLWTFSTAHEKQEVWKNLRRQMFPEEFPYMFSKEYMIIRKMLSVRTQDRPEASQIKKHLEECRRLNAPHSSRSV